MYAQSNVGIGTNDPKSKLDVKGGVTIGDNYSGVHSAPTNGAIIEGQVGIGTNLPNPAAVLDVNSTNQGIRIPSVPLVSITNPIAGAKPDGLMVYNTSTSGTYPVPGLYIWSQSANDWKRVITDATLSGTLQPLSNTSGGGLTTFTYNGGTATTVGIANDGITNAMLQDNVVTTNEIQNGTITSTDLATPAVNASNQIFNTLPVANGGTGTSSTPANGNLLIGNGSGYNVTTLTAGSGINVTNGAGTISISTTGAPPTGTAGGDLTGNYPNPTITTNAVGSAEISDNSVTGTDINESTLVLDGLVDDNDIAANAVDGGAGGELQDGTVDANDLASTTVTANSYGSATQVATFTVDADGRLTAAGNVTISGVAPGGAAGGDLTGNYPNPTITTNAVGSAEISDNSVTGTDINESTLVLDGLVDDNDIAANAVDGGAGGEIQDGTITSADLATTGVTANTYNNVTVNAQGQVTGGSNVAYLTANQNIALTGDVTGSGTTSIATTIASNAVTNAKLNDMAVNTIKGRVTAGTGDPEDLTAAQVKSMLGLSSGVNGSGTLNYVPKWTPDGATIGNSQIFDNGTNVGVGTASPSTKFHVLGDAMVGSGTNTYFSAPAGSGAITLNGNTSGAIVRMVMNDGSGTYNQYQNAYFDGTNWKYNAAAQATRYTSSAGTLSMQVAASGAAGNNITWQNGLYIDNSANVGIGTNSPAYKLDVNGSFKASSVNVNGAYTLPTAAGTTSQFLRGDGTWQSVPSSADNLGNHTATTTLNMGANTISFLTSAGNGIQWGAGPYSRIYENGQLYIQTDDNMYFTDMAGTSRMYINTGTGNVGIGTTAPAEKLDVAGNIYIQGNYIRTAGYNQDAIRMQNDVNWTFGGYNSGSNYWMQSTYYDVGDNLRGFRVLDRSNSSVVFATNKSNSYFQFGNVGVGTTTPAYKLSVNGTIEAIDFGAAGSQNVRVGDDSYLSDMDEAHTMGILSSSNAAYGRIRLGNGSTVVKVTEDQTGDFGSAAAFDFDDATSSQGILMEGGNEESGGFFANGNTAAIWSPGDGSGGLLSVYDEDAMSITDPRFRVNGSGETEARYGLKTEKQYTYYRGRANEDNAYTYNLGAHDFCYLAGVSFYMDNNVTWDIDNQCNVYPTDWGSGTWGDGGNQNQLYTTGPINYGYASKPSWQMYVESYIDNDAVFCGVICFEFNY